MAGHLYSKENAVDAQRVSLFAAMMYTALRAALIIGMIFMEIVAVG